MDKRILIPTDFSKNALNAIRYAAELYRDQNCVFYILHTYLVKGYSIDRPDVPENDDLAYETARRESDKGLEKLFEILAVQRANPKHEYQAISTFHSLLYAMKTTIAQYDIDMVIMGTKGATNSERIVFGTNTIDAMENITECPVMAIPENLRFKKPKEIVFPTDYKTNFRRRELNYLLDIASFHQAAIRILHIEKEAKLTYEQRRNKELLHSILAGTDHSYHTLKDLKVKTGISAFIESRGSDMIAFVNRKHGFFGNILSRPLVKEMGYHSKIPVLALHDES